MVRQQHHSPTALPSGKTCRAVLDDLEKNSNFLPLPGFEPDLPSRSLFTVTTALDILCESSSQLFRRVKQLPHTENKLQIGYAETKCLRKYEDVNGARTKQCKICEFLTSVLMKKDVFRNVRLCRKVKRYGCSRGESCLHLQGQIGMLDPGNWGTLLFRNVRKILPLCAA